MGKVYSKLVAVVLLLGLVVLGACAPKAAPVPQAAAPAPKVEAVAPAPVAAAPVKAAWEEQWTGLVAAAKKEGSLVLYSTAGGTMRASLSQALMEKFGLRMEFISGKGAEISGRLMSERRAGLYLADNYIGGAGTLVTQLKPAGILDPPEPQIFLPEALDPKVWYGGGLRWIDKDRLILAFTAFAQPPLTINTTMVKPEELKAYRDLLNPKWKGKIILNDPTVAGVGEKFVAVVGGRIMGYDYIRELVKQEPIILRDQRLQVEWVARGKYPIAVTTKPEIVTEFQKAGSPLAWVTPAEGTFITGGSGNIALINRAPHPNAAKLFINWLLTKEGQTVFVKAYGAPSGRLDVPTEGLDPATLLQPGVKYYPGDDEELLLKQPEYYKVAEEIFAPFIKK